MANKTLMKKTRNILFIMCDQLRFDYLSCYGHKRLHTPNIDKLAERGVKFTNAYCQAPLCAPSRASFYSGRYMSSHGVMGNDDPTRLDEKLMADYLRPLGLRTAVVGKTHSFKNRAEISGLGIDPDSDFVKRSLSGGFEPFEHHEGLYPDPILPKKQGYSDYLRRQGYDSENPWNQTANSSLDAEGNLHSGWRLRSSKFPAAVKEEHSETAFTTQRAMDFMLETGDQPWCLHLSYIKPHWPVIAPAPYHQMYKPEDIQPVVCSEQERENPHPVFKAFMDQEYSESFARKEVRNAVIPAYMGLVKQIDDHLGRLFDFMQTQGLLDNTMIVFTTDHGDYLGDHWLGEKDLMHDASAKIPLIVVDPRDIADSTRGMTREQLVEAVDVLPSFIEFAGGDICRERLEGRSLMPLLQGKKSPDWREYCISEIDYADRGPRGLLGLEPYQCRAIMVRDSRWKFIYHLNFEPQLFDLLNDPDELVDQGRNTEFESVRRRMKDMIFEWRDGLKCRSGMSYADALKLGPELDEEYGIIIGRW